MDIEINNQGAAVVEPKNKKPETSLRWQLEMELLANQNSRLIDQRNKLLDMVERLQSEKPVKQTPSTITMLQTPVGYVKIGDIVCYDRFNKQLRFGTVVGFEDSNLVKIHHAYTVKFGQDGKQTVYSMLNCSIENYRICDIL